MNSHIQTALQPFSLVDKTALVTGASSGIGQAQSIALAKAGAHVVLVGRREDALKATAETITGFGGEASVLAYDLHDRNVFPSLSAAAHACTGMIDIVVNAAGVNYRESSDDITAESWDRTLNLNLSVPGEKSLISRHYSLPAHLPTGWHTVLQKVVLPRSPEQWRRAGLPAVLVAMPSLRAFFRHN